MRSPKRGKRLPQHAAVDLPPTEIESWGCKGGLENALSAKPEGCRAVERPAQELQGVRRWNQRHVIAQVVARRVGRGRPRRSVIGLASGRVRHMGAGQCRDVRDVREATGSSWYSGLPSPRLAISG